jgi:hypothetical protein
MCPGWVMTEEGCGQRVIVEETRQERDDPKVLA